jgi:hypothetical protein
MQNFKLQFVQDATSKTRIETTMKRLRATKSSRGLRHVIRSDDARRLSFSFFDAPARELDHSTTTTRFGATDNTTSRDNILSIIRVMSSNRMTNIAFSHSRLRASRGVVISLDDAHHIVFLYELAREQRIHLNLAIARITKHRSLSRRHLCCDDSRAEGLR